MMSVLRCCTPLLMVLLVVLMLSALAAPMALADTGTDPWDGESWEVGGSWEGGRVFLDLALWALWYGLKIFQ